MSEEYRDTASKFDAYAREYGRIHEQNLTASGEGPEYFANYKLDCLLRAGAKGPILDYGCGIGQLTVKLAQAFEQVHGCDPSQESLRVARERVPTATFWAGAPPEGEFETVVLAGVLHHIPRVERDDTLRQVRRALTPSGRVIVFEHNPLNPITQKAVRECPFDDDAVLLWPRELRRRFVRAGFSSVHVDYIVFFPRPLRALRPLEPKLRWCALGAQTMTVATR
jgi:SAM-dependent methyltransferase